MSRTRLDYTRSTFNTDEREALQIIERRLNELGDLLSRITVPSVGGNAPPVLNTDLINLEDYVFRFPERDNRNIIFPQRDLKVGVDIRGNMRIGTDIAEVPSTHSDDMRGVWFRCDTDSYPLGIFSHQSGGFLVQTAGSQLNSAGTDFEPSGSNPGWRTELGGIAAAADTGFAIRYQPVAGDNVGAVLYPFLCAAGSDNRGLFFMGKTNLSGQANPPISSPPTFDDFRLEVFGSQTGNSGMGGIYTSVFNNNDAAVAFFTEVTAPGGHASPGGKIGRWRNAGTNGQQLDLNGYKAKDSGGSDYTIPGSSAEHTGASNNTPGYMEFAALDSNQALDDFRINSANYVSFASGVLRLENGSATDEIGTAASARKLVYDAGGSGDTEIQDDAGTVLATLVTGGASPYLLKDGTDTGATSQRQIFTNGIAIPAGLSPGISLNSGTDDALVFYRSSPEECGFSLNSFGQTARLNASADFFITSSGRFLVGNGSLTSTTLTLNTDLTITTSGLTNAVGAAAYFVMNCNDGVQIVDDTASSGRAILDVFMNHASPTRTYAQFRDQTDVHLDITQTGINNFLKADSEMSTSGAFGWTFNTGASVVGDVYNFQVNGSDILALGLATGSTLSSDLEITTSTPMDYSATTPVISWGTTGAGTGPTTDKITWSWNGSGSNGSTYIWEDNGLGVSMSLGFVTGPICSFTTAAGLRFQGGTAAANDDISFVNQGTGASGGDIRFQTAASGSGDIDLEVRGSGDLLLDVQGAGALTGNAGGTISFSRGVGAGAISIGSTGTTLSAANFTPVTLSTALGAINLTPVAGAVNINGAALASVTINGDGANADTSIQGDTDTQLTYWDAGNETVTVGGNLSTGKFNVNGTIFLNDKLILTQTDGNEYIDSLTDGEVDVEATTSVNTRINGAEQIQVLDGIFQPSTNNDIDLGTASLRFKDSYFSGLINRSTEAGITASTTQTQGQGPLTEEVNEVSTVANTGDTVTLPTAAAGLKIVIVNNGANAMSIFPASGDDLGAGANTKMTTDLAAGDMAIFTAYDATNWRGFRETAET